MAKKTTEGPIEQVLVVERKHIPDILLADGFHPGIVFINKILEFSFFMDRDKAENDPTYKQIIPQIVVRNKKGELLVVQRLKTQGEARLHGRHSINIGGHINPEDQDGTNVLMACARRELSEELTVCVEQASDLKWLGTLNNESNEVGLVHFGVVLQLTFNDDVDVQINETDKMVGGWMTLDDAAQHYENMENWAQIIYNQIRKE